MRTLESQVKRDLSTGLAELHQGAVNLNDVYCGGRTLLEMCLFVGDYRTAHALLGKATMDVGAPAYQAACVVDLALSRKDASDLVERMIVMGFPLLGRHWRSNAGLPCPEGLILNAITRARLPVVRRLCERFIGTKVPGLNIQHAWECACAFACDDVFDWVYTHLVANQDVDHDSALADAIAHGQQTRAIWFFDSGLCGLAARMPSSLHVLGFAALHKAPELVQFILERFGAEPFSAGPISATAAFPNDGFQTYLGLALPTDTIVDLFDKYGLFNLDLALYLPDFLQFIRQAAGSSMSTPAVTILKVLGRWPFVELLCAGEDMHAMCELITGVVRACANPRCASNDTLQVELDAFLRDTYKRVKTQFPVFPAIYAAANCADDGSVVMQIVRHLPVPHATCERDELCRELRACMAGLIDARLCTVGVLDVLVERYCAVALAPWCTEHADVLIMALRRDWRYASVFLNAGWTAALLPLETIMTIFSFLYQGYGLHSASLKDASIFLRNVLARICRAREWQDDESAALGRVLLHVADKWDLHEDCYAYADQFFARAGAFRPNDLRYGLDDDGDMIERPAYQHSNACILMHTISAVRGWNAQLSALTLVRRHVAMSDMQSRCMTIHRRQAQRLFVDLDRCALYNTYREKHFAFQAWRVVSFPPAVRCTLVQLLLVARATTRVRSPIHALIRRLPWSVLARMFYLLTRYPADAFEAVSD